MIDMTFGEFFKRKRIESRQTLRAFCRKHDLDPGNISKLERGRTQAPRSEERLLEYADYLSLDPGESETFKDLAAISAGRIPKDLTEGELAKRLPVLFGLARDKDATAKDLMKIVDLVRNA